MPPRDPSIDEILRAAFRAYRAGDEHAADLIARHLLPVMMRKAGIIFKNRPEDTEDAAHTALMKLLAALPGMEVEVRDPTAFSRAIARNVSLNMIRSQQKMVSLSEEAMRILSIVNNNGRTPEDELVLRDFCEEIESAMGTLSAKCRMLIRDRFWLDKKLKELYGPSGYKSEQAVHKKIERCLEKLRKVIKQRRLVRQGSVLKRLQKR
ncbi:MAG: sigma-70 family RNA polymerase sigma factor [Candidatus Krumholzibacteriota bacterium]|nr:sigma-70 family RNA polymerase sigma factor [Candidatus Krumholzibacteriota bacterium]